MSRLQYKTLRCFSLMVVLSAGTAALAQTGPLAEKSSADATTLSNERSNFERARQVADAVLKGPEFQRQQEDTWWDKKKQQFSNVLMRAVARVAKAGRTVPWMAKALEWTLFTGAAVGLLLFLLRELRRQRAHVSLADGAIKAEAWTREADDWSQRAERYAEKAEWREAMHCLYWAAIVFLESRKAWRHNPTRTPREYVRLLKPGSAQQQGLRALTQIFERSWYGLREVNGEQYADARSLYDGLKTASSFVQQATAEVR